MKKKENKITKKAKELVLNPMLSVAMALTPVAATLPLTSCFDDSGKKEQKVEINVISLSGALSGYDVTIENRSGKDITAILTKLQDAFDGLSFSGQDLIDFKSVLDRNVTIAVQGGTSYNGYHIVNDHTMSFHYD